MAGAARGGHAPLRPGRWHGPAVHPNPNPNPNPKPNPNPNPNPVRPAVHLRCAVSGGKAARRARRGVNQRTAARRARGRRRRRGRPRTSSCRTCCCRRCCRGCCCCGWCCGWCGWCCGGCGWCGWCACRARGGVNQRARAAGGAAGCAYHQRGDKWTVQPGSLHGRCGLCAWNPKPKPKPKPKPSPNPNPDPTPTPTPTPNQVRLARYSTAELKKRLLTEEEAAADKADHDRWMDR